MSEFNSEKNVYSLKSTFKSYFLAHGLAVQSTTALDHQQPYQ